MNKTCRKCNKSYHTSLFYKRSAVSDGLDSYCISCRKEFTNSYYDRNRESQLKRVKNYQQENPDKVSRTRLKRIDKMNKYAREYKKAKFNSDPLFKLSCNLRRSISHAFSGKRKSKNSIKLLGCPFADAKKHLERLFQPGMTWENYGKWHLDHKIPLSSANNIESLEKLWYYTNLQLLWAKDNLTKSDKLNWTNKQS